VNRRRSLDAIRRDDDLIDALATGTAPDSDPLALALAEWRRDLDAEPVRAPRFAALRRRVGRGVASAAVASTIGLLSVGGVAAAATQAGPDSALWPITRVVAADRAQSREAAYNARDLLRRARAAADAHRPDDAARYLDQAEQDTRRVRRGDGERELREHAAALRLLVGGPPAEPSPTASQAAPPSVAPSPSPSPGGTGGVTPDPTPTPDGSPSGSPSPRPVFPRPTDTAGPSPEPSRTTPPSRTPEPSPTHDKASPGVAGLTDGGLDLLQLLLPPAR
jgi:hypothetical protein